MTSRYLNTIPILADFGGAVSQKCKGKPLLKQWFSLSDWLLLDFQTVITGKDNAFGELHLRSFSIKEQKILSTIHYRTLF